MFQLFKQINKYLLYTTRYTNTTNEPNQQETELERITMTKMGCRITLQLWVQSKVY